MTTQPVTAHLPVELVQRLDQLAARLDRSRSWIVKQAVDSWIDHQAERDRLTEEALASAEAGRLIDHEQIERWLDSFDTPHRLPIPQP